MGRAGTGGHGWTRVARVGRDGMPRHLRLGPWLWAGAAQWKVTNSVSSREVAATVKARGEVEGGAGAEREGREGGTCCRGGATEEEPGAPGGGVGGGHGLAPHPHPVHRVGHQPLHYQGGQVLRGVLAGNVLLHLLLPLLLPLLPPT